MTRLLKRLDQEPDWVKVLPINPIPAILQRDPAGVRLHLLSLLAGDYDFKQTIIKELRRMAWDTPEAERLLKKQLDDGSWPVEINGLPEGAAKQLTLLGLLENLHALVCLGADRSWPGVKKGLRLLLSFQNDDGRFPLPYHQHASIGRLLIRSGFGRNPAVSRAAHWIMDRQRDDGGWLYPQMARERQHQPSCIWTTAEVLSFIARYPTLRIKERLQQAGEFLMAHALEANTTSLLPGTGTWDALQEGSRGMQLFGGGTLKVLDGLTLAGFNPSYPVFKKLYTWLLRQQLDDGYYPSVAGLDQRGNPMVTVRVLEVISRVETTRPG